METVKEKLANLINEAKEYHISECVKMLTCAECSYKGTNCKALHKAEYLIQNGVTIQEWVSVDERLPEFITKHKFGDRGYYEKSVRVLCTCVQKDGKRMVKEGYCERWVKSQAICWRIPGTIDKVTHWQPLPEPAKGE